MPSISETGHAKNVANFKELITFCESYGTNYNPNKDTLKIENLKKLLETAQKELENVIQKNTAFNNAITTRQNTFANLKPLLTKITNAFAVTNAPEQSIADAKTLNKKIQGTRTTKKTNTITTDNTTVVTDTKTISTSQQSYDSLTEHVSKVISLLESEPSYKPNEKELQTKSLQTLVEQMKGSTNNVNIAFSEVSNARISRNEIIYNESTGLYNTAMDIKKYIKSVFGATSPQYKQISKIKFTTTR